jgi:hypothetical protein
LRRFLEVALEGNGVTDEELADLPRVNAILVPISIPEGLSEDEVAALAHLVEEVVAARSTQNGSVTVVGRKGEPIPIDESEIEVWLSPGSFG